MHHVKEEGDKAEKGLAETAATVGNKKSPRPKQSSTTIPAHAHGPKEGRMSMSVIGSGSGRLPKQNVGKSLGEARAAAWCREQETTRTQKQEPLKGEKSSTAGKKAKTSAKT